MGVREAKNYINGQFKIIGIMIAICIIAYIYSSVDRAVNYVKTDAVVDDIIIDCYVKNNGKKLRDSETKETLFFTCERAKIVASANGLKIKDVYERHNIYYSYKSPVDNSIQKGIEDLGAYPAKRYSVGKKISIYASLNDPAINELGWTEQD